jgi:hypothetical protein
LDFKHKFSTSAMLITLTFSPSSHAALDVWDSATPWGAATPTYFAGWDDFDAVPIDSTPDVAGSGAGTFTFSVAGASLLPDNNVFTPPNNTNGAYQALLSAGTGGFYDVYFRMESIRSLPSDMTATLIIDDDITGVPPSSLIGSQLVTYNSGSAEYEYYWVWNNIPGSTFFNVFVNQDSLTVNNLFTITNLAEIAAVPIATAVPEPETYAMFLAGLGLMGFMTRRKTKSS